jgi:ABC-type transporter Mla subunit MlaD
MIPDNTTDHSILVYIFGILLLGLTFVFGAVVVWFSNKVLTLWEKNIKIEEKLNTFENTIYDLKATLESLRKVVNHLETTLQQKDQNKNTIDKTILEILYKIEERIS